MSVRLLFSRRRLIASLAAVVGFSGRSFAGRPADTERGEDAVLLGLDRQNLAVIGRTGAAAPFRARGSYALAAALARDFGWSSPDHVTRSVRRVAMARADAIRSDFDAGRIVAVEGWHLSETELRLAALAAILETQPEVSA